MTEREIDRPRMAVALGVAVVLGLAALALGLWQFLAARGIDVAALSSSDVKAFVQAWGAWAAAGAIVLMVLHSFVPLPAEIIAIANGALFGPWWGVLVTWVGAMLGAILAFAAARSLGRPVLRWAVPARYWARLEAVPVKPVPLLIVRLIPVISFNLVNYAAGLLGVPWWTFLWTTALGILPLVVTMVGLGRQLMAAPWWIWMLAAAAILACWLLGRALRPWSRGTRDTSGGGRA